MKHLYFVQTTKGIWVPGGLYEDKRDAIQAARAINAEKEIYTRLEFNRRPQWKNPKHRSEKVLAG